MQSTVATDSLNNLVGQFADQKPVIDKALKTIPDALAVLKDERETIADALGEVSKFGALAADSVNKTKENLVTELKDLGPVLQSLADAGPALTRSLDFFGTFPFPTSTLSKWIRGDYANLTAVIDLTLSRLDSSFFTGTRFEWVKGHANHPLNIQADLRCTAASAAVAAGLPVPTGPGWTIPLPAFS